MSQQRARVFGKGHGEAVPCDVGVSETIVPIADAVMFNTAGGQAAAGTTPDGAQTEILTYTGVQLGGGGTLVGPGAAPSVAPTLALAGGTGLSLGTYQYAYTDITASGETLPSPLGTVATATALANPTSFPNTATYDGTGSLFPDGPRDWAYTWLDSNGGETLPSPRVTRYSVNPIALKFYHPLPVGPAGTAKRRLYRTVVGASSPTGLTLQLVATINDNTTTTYGDGLADGSLGAAAPSSSSSTLARVSVSAIASGPATVTSRKVYRTVVNGSQLKLLTTIADNTTTTYADSSADAALGANAPLSDTSALSQPSGQILSGASTVLTANTAAFQGSPGGWASAGSLLFRYRDISINTLTGVPASGTGSITVSIPYNTVILAVPALTGVNGNNGVTRAMQAGATVHIWVERNDLDAQAALAALEGGDGIREFTISDERRGEESITALCDADLAIFSLPIVGATYACRDPKTRSGKTVSIDLHAGFYDKTFYDPTSYGGGAVYGVAGDFTIQSVDITFDAPGLLPRYTVHAASTAFSLADVLKNVVLRS